MDMPRWRKLLADVRAGKYRKGGEGGGDERASTTSKLDNTKSREEMIENGAKKQLSDGGA